MDVKPLYNEDFIQKVMVDWEEYLEMDPEHRWEMVARILSNKLANQVLETQYYKKVADAHFAAKS